MSLLKIATDQYTQTLIDRHRDSYDDVNKRSDELEAARAAYNPHVGLGEKLLRGATMVGAPVAGTYLGARFGNKIHPDAAASGAALGGLTGLVGGAVGQYGIRSGFDKKNPDRVPIREARDEAGQRMEDSAINYFDAYEHAHDAAMDNPTAYRALSAQNPHAADAGVLNTLRDNLRQQRLHAEQDRQLNRETMESTRDYNRSRMEQ